MDDRWTAGTRVVANQIDRARWRTTLTYRFHPAFTAGMEYNPLARKASPLANWLVAQEGHRRPAIILGTSSDRIGTPSGQSFYATASKDLSHTTGLPVAPYIGAAYGTYENRLRAIGGLDVRFTGRWNALLIFDGVHLHSTLDYRRGRHVVSLLLVRGNDPGVSYSVSF
ncbi:MAG TPA: hypothetical protein VJV23_12420 [Candidatus Polarisedimenticolia bacterium]|nr:hypothetical protein [Candidatus Polarisedimenticolia bacterium]